MKGSDATRQDPKRLEVDDLTLSAWLDEELDVAEARRVQAAVDAQPGLQQRLARLLVNERRLREHYAAMADARPVPAPMRALLTADDAPARPWLLRLSDWTAQILPRPVMAAGALALALVVGIQLGGDGMDELAVPGPSQVMTPIGPDHDWFGLLESAPSGETLELVDSQSGQVALSYQDVGGRWCRQFTVQSPAERSAMAAVACRDGEEWKIDLAQAIPFRPQNDGFFRAASSGEAAAIDAHIMEQLSGDVLMRAAESELIEQSWNRASPDSRRPE
ncbi:MAG: hypothetical protein V2J10_11765 [Wenzhouxiangella sp.]|jgi:hypothetical protein|nr:hypothetical protein [Wenzhouxiangella sp.]